MAQENPLTLQKEINKEVKFLLDEHSSFIHTNGITITNENFEKLKTKIRSVLTTLGSNHGYEISYYMKPKNAFTITEYVVTIIIQKDYELVMQSDINYEIKIESVSEINYEDVREMTFFEFLTETNNQHELTHFFESLADYEASCVIDGQWESTLHTYGLSEWEYFDSLNESEKETFAKAQGFTYAKNIIHKPISYSTRIYDLEFINTLFDKIQLVEK